MTGSWKNASGVLECRGPRSVAVRPTPTQQLVKSGDRKTAGCRLNIFLRRLRCHWHDRLEQPTDGRGHYTTCCGRLLLLSKHLDVTDDSHAAPCSTAVSANDGRVDGVGDVYVLRGTAIN